MTPRRRARIPNSQKLNARRQATLTAIETIFNPVAVVETAIEKGAASILMPISSRRQLNDLPDDLAAKITVHYYIDARDALLKSLAI
jgi:ATP-dependent Lon protease